MLELNLFLRCSLELDLYLLLEWVFALLLGFLELEVHYCFFVDVVVESGLNDWFSGAEVILLSGVRVGVESVS